MKYIDTKVRRAIADVIIQESARGLSSGGIDRIISVMKLTLMDAGWRPPRNDTKVIGMATEGDHEASVDANPPKPNRGTGTQQ